MANPDEQSSTGAPKEVGEGAAEAIRATQPAAAVKRDKTLEWDLRAVPRHEVAVGVPAVVDGVAAPGLEATASPDGQQVAGMSGRALLDLPGAQFAPAEPVPTQSQATPPLDTSRATAGDQDPDDLEVEVALESDGPAAGAGGGAGEDLGARSTPEPLPPRVDEASQLGAAPEGPAPLIEDSTAPLPVEELAPATSSASELPTPPPERVHRPATPPPVPAGLAPVAGAMADGQPVGAPSVTPPPVPVAAISAPAAVGRPATPPAAGASAGRPDAAPRVPPIPAAALEAAAAPSWAEPLKPRPRAKRAKPWYEEVFDEDYLRTLPFMTAEQTLREANFIHDCVGVPPGGEILDVGCGYGRHAIELAQRGLKVTGLDLSLPLLIRAADESQRRGLTVNFVHADMREMNFDAQFDGAYCALTTFGYFDEETNLKVATGICKALKPGGRFLLDVLNRDYIVADLPTRVWWEGDGCVVLEEVDFNFHTSRVGIRRSIVFQDGRQFEHDISIRAYSLHEIGRLLRQAGLRVIEVSGGIATRGRFFGATSRSMITLCEKPAI